MIKIDRATFQLWSKISSMYDVRRCLTLLRKKFERFSLILFSIQLT